jgi:type I restriction enzyme M protein
LQEDGHLLHFDAVISNPPIGTNWNSFDANQDPFNRFRWGVPQNSRADYAFISHIIETLNPNGRAVILVPHGILSREGVEGAIRQKLIEENLIEAVIGLPSNLLYGTAMRTAILVINKNKSDQNILFVDGSQEYGKEKNHVLLREQDSDKILNAYREHKNIPILPH